MKGLNYNHLFYFWHVARQGSLSRASATLGLSPSTISTQIRDLERALGERLFLRRGKGMMVSDFGQSLLPYAEGLSAVDRELREHLRDRAPEAAPRLRVGIANGVHRVLASFFLAPLFESGTPVRLLCRGDASDRLMSELAAQALDVVLADQPSSPSVRVKAFNHLLGESGTTFFAARRLARSLKGEFPRCLDGAPLLLPTPSTAVRDALDRWFEARGVRPRVVGEIEDSAIMKVFGSDGVGVFTASTALARQVALQYVVRPIGQAPEVRERFYAITVERRIRHPLVAAITRGARTMFTR